MTPVEKAKELVKRFHPMTYTAVHAQDTTGEYADAIRCALIAVDEIINSIPCREEGSGNGTVLIENTDYWIEVKNELENL